MRCTGGRLTPEIRKQTVARMTLDRDIGPPPSHVNDAIVLFNAGSRGSRGLLGGASEGVSCGTLCPVKCRSCPAIDRSIESTMCRIREDHVSRGY